MSDLNPTPQPDEPLPPTSDHPQAQPGDSDPGEPFAWLPKVGVTRVEMDLESQAGQSPLPAGPRWELPCPRCGECPVQSLSDPALPGAEDGTINGTWYRANKFLEDVKTAGYEQALVGLRQSDWALEQILATLPEIDAGPEGSPDYSLIDSMLEDMASDSISFFEGSGRRFQLSLLPRFCRLIPAEVDQELILRALENSFLYEHYVPAQVLFGGGPAGQNFSELKNAIEDIQVAHNSLTLAGEQHPSIAEIIQNYLETGRKAALFSAILYLRGR